MSLAEGELKRRDRSWKPFTNWSNPQSDGKLAVPIAGLAPFDRPERVTAEITRLCRLCPGRAVVMLQEFAKTIEAEWRRSGQSTPWTRARAACSDAIANLITSRADSLADYRNVPSGRSRL
jgi:hypothetical protein